VWHSQKDKNLLFSWVLDVHCDLAMVPRIPLLIAAKIASVLHIFVKWPNDLVDKQYRKVGGILSSVLDVGEKSHTIVVGVGLNINQTEFGDIENAVSLKEIREKQEDIDILDVFVQIFSALQHMDLMDSLDGWKQYNLTVGKTVRINGIEGVVEGILDDGALVVAGQIIRTGDVHLI
jgi:BirA family biotin operon repressor/biotin-[acetyl-CoA-carboxylase] ligase